MQAIAERNPAVGEAMARVMEMSADERTRREYEARQKALMDYATRMRGAREEGIAEGIKKGITQGRTEGEHNKAVSIAKNLIAANTPIDVIISVTDLTRAEIECLKGGHTHRR